MQLRYLIPAVMAILTLSFCQANELYAHGARRSSGSASAAATQAAANQAARLALAARFAAQNPQLSTQQASVLAGQQALASTAALQQAALLATQNPQLTAQQAALLAGREIPSISSQIQAANTSVAQLAKQILGQNPQLSPQQANIMAGQEISAISSQLASTYTASPTPTGVSSTATSPGVPIYGNASGFYGNGAYQATLPTTTGVPSYNNGEYPSTLPTTDLGGESGGVVEGIPQTAAGAALQGTAQLITATGQSDLATAAADINMTQAESNALRNQVQGVQTFYELRAAGRTERELERGAAPTAAELARRAARMRRAI